MSISQAEIDSLRRQVKALTLSLASMRRKHFDEIGLKEVIITKKNTRHDRLEKTIANLNRENFFNNARLKSQGDKLGAQQLKIEQMRKELSHVCAESDAVKKRLNDVEEAISRHPGAVLRLQIKQLCAKYHPDKRGKLTVPTDEVARELIHLLSL